jgi:hypothetical protein
MLDSTHVLYNIETTHLNLMGISTMFRMSTFKVPIFLEESIYTGRWEEKPPELLQLLRSTSQPH